MDVLIKSAELEGQVCSISSKSHTHRLLIASALSGAHTDIICPEISDDLRSTARCLSALGMRAQKTKYGFSVDCCESGENACELDCGESGATLRFMLPVVCALGIPCTLIRHSSLKKRPIEPLIDSLREHGCDFEISDMRIKCSGKLTPGEYKIDGSLSSQFTSALLLALPLIDGDSIIEIVGESVSSPYIDMTLGVLSLFGIEAQKREGGFFVKGKQHYKSPGKLVAEGDWSCAAVWLCAGAIGKKSVAVSGLDINSKQGDRKIVEILRRFGAEVTEEKGTFRASRKKLRGIEIDAADTPDIIPPLCVVAAVSRGKTVIKNASHLRAKESNRIRAIAQILSTLGAHITENADGLIIEGREELSGGSVPSFDDHRMIMMASLAASVSDEPVLIFDAQNVSKSYPDFFTHLEALGAEIRIR